jgi:hypothetical protein
MKVAHNKNTKAIVKKNTINNHQIHFNNKTLHNKFKIKSHKDNINNNIKEILIKHKN